MECTQRLEYTQDLNVTQVERVSPEQVGFLGICGKTYPVMQGPNKIGRDPQTCGIVLNLNSVSRQHAVINILNKKEFMLMDLDSANKTKLLNKNLHPYIPHPLKNGDTVQFGEVFGIFRLLEEDDNLPMTQAIDIPETPVFNKHASRLNRVPITTVPESPDVSDRDDSFIIPSQPVDKRDKYAGNHNFIKPAINTIAIQPVGTNKIDNVFWNASKKSTSLSMTLNDSSTRLSSTKSDAVNDIKVVNINDMETQPPKHNESTSEFQPHSIHLAETQIHGGLPNSPSIHSLNTQLPVATTEHLPQVQKIHNQLGVQLDLFTANKENENSIYNADTQMLPGKDTSFSLKKKSIAEEDNTRSSKSSNNKSDDDELLLDDVDDPILEDDFESQAILPQDIPLIFANRSGSDQLAEMIKKSEAKPKLRVLRLKSDSSTDCEDVDILPTQQIPVKEVIDDDITDCEDNFIELNVDKSKTLNNIALEELETQVICNQDIHFDDLPTQIITIEEPIRENPVKEDENFNIEDMCTQVITNAPELVNTQPENNSLHTIDRFKVPTPLKIKKKDTTKPKLVERSPDEKKMENYYNDTQELCQDLCSQQTYSPEVVGYLKNSPSNSADKKPKTGFSSTNLVSNKMGSSDSGDKIDAYVSRLSRQQIKDVIGVAPLRKNPSEGSDVDVTPKKVRPSRFMAMDLPNSQEIKTSVSLPTKSLITDSSSDSEDENNSEEQYTPILFNRSKKPKIDAKIDLSKKFEIDALPSRILSRRRKPTEKAKCAEENKCRLNNILKPKFMADEEDTIDSDIITENISRLKSKYDKPKYNKNTQKKNELKSDKNNKSVDVLAVNMKETSKRAKDENTGPQKEITGSKTFIDVSSKTLDTTNESRQFNDEGNNIHVEAEETSTKKLIGKPKESRRGRSKKNTDKEKTIETNIDLTKRNTRARNKKNDKKSLTPEYRRVPRSSDKREHSKNNEEREPSLEETDVRRSKRQRVAKEKKQKEIIKVKITSKLKKLETHEQSTVYNVSSASSSGSPRSLKRAAIDSVGPNAKRTKSANSSVASLRVTPARQARTHYVLFTAFPCEEVRMKLENLGAVVVTEVTACTVVLTLQVKRTFKLMCAVGLGRPIVGPDWVQACADSNTIVDPWLYIMMDETAEKKFHFSLKRTLTGNRNFLNEYNISSTPSVQPKASEMKLIVECSGGKWKEGGSQWVCVSSSADRNLWPSLRRRGATIVTTEFILGGVLKQELDIRGNMY